MAVEQPNSYQSYLLRLWRSSPHGAWHGSLQNTANDEKHSFADLSGLWAFLAAQLGVGGQTNDEHLDSGSPSQMQANTNQSDHDYTTKGQQNGANEEKQDDYTIDQALRT